MHQTTIQIQTTQNRSIATIIAIPPHMTKRSAEALFISKSKDHFNVKKIQLYHLFKGKRFLPETCHSPSIRVSCRGVFGDAAHMLPLRKESVDADRRCSYRR